MYSQPAASAVSAADVAAAFVFLVAVVVVVAAVVAAAAAAVVAGAVGAHVCRVVVVVVAGAAPAELKNQIGVKSREQKDAGWGQGLRIASLIRTYPYERNLNMSSNSILKMVQLHTRLGWAA